MNWHCRIGKVTPKAGLSIVPRHVSGLTYEAVNDMKNKLDLMASYMPHDLAGIAIVVWSLDGSFNRATKHHVRSPIGPTWLPAFVAEVLRRDTMTTIAREELDAHGLSPLN